MNWTRETQCTAFAGQRLIATGDLARVAVETKKVIDAGELVPILIFDNKTSALIEVDFRGTPGDVAARLPSGSDETAGTVSDTEAARGPGRPKLGVVAREVTLLPRHWEWLNSQPGGASVALRKLVEDAKRANQDTDHRRNAQEATYKFMSAIAGNSPGFEEATRALFASDMEKFDKFIKAWPKDVREHTKKLASAATAGE